MRDVLDRCHDEGIFFSYSTLWRILDQDAIRPWFWRPWIFPRDPYFLEKASPVLDLYARQWQGSPLNKHDLVLCGDEMTGLQALSRIHPCQLPGPRTSGRYEFEYQRHGSLAYIAFMDVATGHVYGETAPKNGSAPFDACLENCLEQPMCRDAKRVFLILDNGCAHHPHTSPRRLREKFPQVVAVHLPVHASWLNQIELYFSIVHRKALHPADFADLDALTARLLAFQRYHNERSHPFRWNYSRADLARHLARLRPEWQAGSDRPFTD